MRLLSFTTANAPAELAVGVLVPLGSPAGAHTHVVNLTAAFATDGGRPLARGMRQLLEEMDGGGGLERASAAAASGRWRLPLGAITVRAPIYDPEKIICTGMNYYDHCTEQNFPIPREPVFFSKFASSIVGTGEPLPLGAEETQELDFVRAPVHLGAHCDVLHTRAHAPSLAHTHPHLRTRTHANAHAHATLTLTVTLTRAVLARTALAREAGGGASYRHRSRRPPHS